MDIFLSYRDSAGDAEIEFRRLFQKLGHNQSFQLPALATSDGWSRMLPGLVCDLRPDDARYKVPAIFMGMLGEQSMLSCALQASNSLIRKPIMGRLLKGGDYDFQSVRASLQASNRLDFLSKIVEGTVLIQDIEPPRPHPHAFNWDSSGASPFIDNAGRHLRFPNLDQTEYGYDYGGPDSLDHRLTDFLELLAHAPAGTGNDDLFRRLVREYHCRFAWASVQLDEPQGQVAMPMVNAPFVFEPNTFSSDTNKENIGHLKSFWEKRGLLMKPFSILPQTPLVERRRPISWPYWLQFLVLISNAGRRANATLKKYSFPKLRKLRRKDVFRPVRRLIVPDTTPLTTIAELFRGRVERVPILSELRQPRMHRVPRRDFRSEIRRSLVVPGEDTIFSLYRGDVKREPDDEE